MTRAKTPPRWAGLTARWLSAAAGIWLMAAPAILGYSGAADTSDRIAGPLIASVSICAAWAILGGMRWLNIALALWLLAAPWILRFPTDATINSTAVAVAVVLLNLVPLSSGHTLGGGWRALAR